MTDVMEPARVSHLAFTERESLGDIYAPAAAPDHCGTTMVLRQAGDTSVLPWTAGEWVCGCGFRLDATASTGGDPLSSVRLASARLETVQWELDSAQELLACALRNASESGATLDALRTAAGMSPSELESLLA
jgi:hypothetical protein